MAKRYDYLIELVKKHQPRTIVEVGVHRGLRAFKMCAEVQGPVHYIGYDVFEHESPAFQEAALNGKGIPMEAVARDRLDKLKARKSDFTYEFRIGDTRETLHGQRIQCDFAFIDGDHRVDAVVGDFQAIDAPVIVMDDYYVPGPDGKTPDLDLYGANVIQSLYDGEILLSPDGDECKHGGISHLAVVIRD